MRFAAGPSPPWPSGSGSHACTSGALQPATPIAVDAGRAASLVSSYRAQNGLGPVTVDSRLMRAAADMALAMGQRDKIGHRDRRLARRSGFRRRVTTGALRRKISAPAIRASTMRWPAGRRRPATARTCSIRYATEIGIAAVATPAGSKKRTYWALILATPRPEPGPGGPFVMEAVQ